jgi:hypothetical protein
MLKVTRCAAPLASLILFAAGFAVVATSAEAIPAFSPAALAMMERAKTAAPENALPVLGQAASTQVAPATECKRVFRGMVLC